MQRLYHIFRASGTRALIPALTGGVFRPIFYKKSKKEVENDFSQRILCSDGNCIGVINEQGVCNTCGKRYVPKPPNG
jgi:hypothetical protein